MMATSTTWQHGVIDRTYFIDSRSESDLGCSTSFHYQFDEPIRNVVGLEVKDSNIPSTSYTIDDC
jgi:hypothetical protein